MNKEIEAMAGCFYLEANKPPPHPTSSIFKPDSVLSDFGERSS